MRRIFRITHILFSERWRKFLKNIPLKTKMERNLAQNLQKGTQSISTCYALQWIHDIREGVAISFSIKSG